MLLPWRAADASAQSGSLLRKDAAGLDHVGDESPILGESNRLGHRAFGTFFSTYT
jgi:hypothetical protein